MTTIFYDAKEGKIAIDSRLTSNNIIETDSAKKYFCFGNEFVFWSGDINAAHSAVNCEIGHAYDLSLEFAFIIVRDSVVYSRYVCKGVMMEFPVDWSFGEGSGACFAMAAHDLGKSARESIEYAATRDVNTGGEIRVFNVADMSFE